MSDTAVQLNVDSKTQNSNIRKPKKYGIYTQIMMTQQVHVSIVNVGDNIKQTLERSIANSIEGKCIVEGFVKPESTRIVSYSSGELRGSDVFYEIIIECLVCCPVEGMHIDCTAKNITETAGIRAEVDDTPSPMIIYIARDHHYNNKSFGDVKVGDNIKVRVIGQRFELNDKYISVIAELIEEKKERVILQKTKGTTAKRKQRLILKK
tara:strand:- start:1171 stop:1794 length:624 start_codon:yes stop_codon:yes gene_type:complete